MSLPSRLIACCSRTAASLALSPVPRNPLGQGQHIRTAAALIIGCVPFLSLVSLAHSRRDEILNGKTLDRNSNYFAQYCFELGIDLFVPTHSTQPTDL